MARRQFPDLWPEWEDLVNILQSAGIDTQSYPARPLHEQGVGYWLDMLSTTPVSHHQVTIISGIVSDVIEAVRAQNKEK